MKSQNRSLLMDFTLEPAQAEWVTETSQKVMDELRQTAPNGRAFAEMVAVVLEREKGWVKWKNETCPTIEKQPWFQEIEEDNESAEGGEKKKRKVGLEEATKGLRRKMREPPAEWQWRLGSAPLTDIWDMGYRDLSDLENPFR